MPEQAPLVYEAGSLEIDTGRRELRARGTPVPIGGRAFEIIEALARSAGELVTKDELMERVWPGAVVEESTLQVHISAIRKAFGPDRAMLKTASGRGYRLLGRWTARQEADPFDRVPERAAAQPVRNNLPGAVSDLIGRAAAVQHVQNLISAYRIVTLTGPGGIGKTRLALEVARALLPGFEGDVWWVELATLSDPNLVTASIVNVLGLHLGGSDTSAEALARAIGGRKLLLVIDNCEHVIDAAARVVDTVIRLCPGASVLATSRELMRIDGECSYRVSPLDFPEQDPSNADPGDILATSAVRLFIARMTAQQFDRQYQNELSAIAAICRRLDGIPLAIEFAAARAATLGLEEVLSRLDDRFALLIGGRRTALPKQQTLRATLDWSYDLLSDPERLLLRRLSIFAGPFSLEAAAAVTGAGAGATGELADGVENLVGKSLVTADFSGVMAHYRLLETTRVYALGKLMEGEGLRQLAQRHAEYYITLLERIEIEQETGPANLADLGNTRAALEWCFAPHGNAEIGTRLAAAAASAFFAHSLMTECHRWSEQALFTLDDAVRGGREEMRLQAALGISLLFARGSTEAARVAMTRGLAIAEEHEDARTQIRLLGPLAIFHVRLGDFNSTLRYAKRASDISRTITDPNILALANCCVGFALLHGGDHAGARVALEAATENRPRSQKYNISYFGFDHYCLACIHLALTLSLQGCPTRAVEYARQTVENAATLNHPVTLSIALAWAVSVFLLTGDLQSAEDYADWLISVAEAHSLAPYIAIGRGFKGELAIGQGRAAAGVEILQRCLADLRAVRYELLITPFSIALAQGLAAVGRFAEAIELIDERIRLVGINGNLGFLPELLRVKGGVLLAMSAPDEAKICFTRSLELSRHQGALAWELRTGVDLATLLVSRGQAESARMLLRPVLDQFAEGLDTPDLKAAERLLAACG